MKQRTQPLSAPFIAFVATLLVSVHASAADSAASCENIAGTFLLTGAQEEKGIATRAITFLERANKAHAHRGHHFTFTFSSTRSVAEVVVYDADGERVFDHTTSPYSCRNGALVRESEIQGGSEGCSKIGRITSKVSLGAEGALTFTAFEQWKYGFFCFAKPSEAERMSVFPAYNAAAK